MRWYVLAGLGLGLGFLVVGLVYDPPARPPKEAGHVEEAPVGKLGGTPVAVTTVGGMSRVSTARIPSHVYKTTAWVNNDPAGGRSIRYIDDRGRLVEVTLPPIKEILDDPFDGP